MKTPCLYLLLAAVTGLVLSACRTPVPPGPPAEAQEDRPAEERDLGRVVQVNPRQGYIILRCAVLPSEGEEVTIIRDEKEVARARVTGPRHPPYFSADVLSGEPHRGDRVRKLANRK